MNTIQSIGEFLGWCSVINLGILIVAAIAVVLFRGPVSSIHSKMFDLDNRDLSRAYFQYLAHYKIAIIVFNIAPYFALKLMS